MLACKDKHPAGPQPFDGRRARAQPVTTQGSGPLIWTKEIHFSQESDPHLSGDMDVQPLPWGKLGLLALTLVALTIPLLARDNPGVQAFALVFVSIVLEALPFMLMGACVGGLIEVFVSREKLLALLPRRPWAVTCVAAALGLVFPVCECAIVPIVRRLARKGFPLSAAVAYLLGGPIVNPIVGASTLLAYKFDWAVVGIRLAAGYIIAVIVGLLMARVFKNSAALLEAPSPQTRCACGHAHGHDHHEAAFRLPGRLLAAVRHASNDFFAVAHYLVIGAAIAALAQTLVDRQLFLSFASVPLLPSLSMMARAILLNLCSEADAFIAASFRTLLPLPAQMAFL
ncbi:MAG: permease, partial [Lentisphaerota bacterium]